MSHHKRITLTLVLPIVLVVLAYVSGYVWLRIRKRQQRTASSQI
jgi:hypothetical protein